MHACRRPEAVAAAVLRVPFVDVLTAMTQPELPLTAHEYGEWGDIHSDPEALHSVRDGSRCACWIMPDSMPYQFKKRSPALALR